MPELPEVETIVNDLRPQVVGRTFAGVETNWAGSVSGMSPEEFAIRIAGKRITDVARRGKNIIIELSGGEVLLIHLRMSGRLTIADPEEAAPRFLRVVLRLDDGRELRFADLRKFGRIGLVPAAQVAELDARLGPEPLADEFTYAAMRSLFSGRRGQVKALLLDQSVVAGVGNIYADEALFFAGIHPHRVAAGLSDDEIVRLHEALRKVLSESIRNRGTTFSDYRDGRGKPGANQDQLMVYRRTGQPCHRCGIPIERLRFGGRGSHLCPHCQPQLAH